ncbi:MAG: acyl-CoA dehydrogenase, partial [Gemmatimonadetes bacterium]|nr:acyl-CoA dehydrogenase [Gemmatimonadota bacterium]NIR79427.1 acyl-CoA dehydrogenase [Gemmatimonadota bacterium]NIT88107.1 acyl-CoA dehydrogenase [Gemmatimonadota bacterium]NIU31934.1 acyl-CoA dehydrogenase [Gemmatimonadota bacterium]NIU36545.1 acyl-CoA dehydrogenase [Gemmatimonadota bacterium]
MTDTDSLQEWVGRSRTRPDEITLAPARAMLALLDRDPLELRKGDPLPEGWHWLYFKPLARRSELGPDGHPARGDFLPPVPLPRRMWAGGRIRFPGRLHIGEGGERRSRVLSVEEKEGRSGRLIFVTVGHEIGTAGTVVVEEEQDLVYAEARSPDDGFGGPPPPGEPAWSESYTAGPVTLFRFSALTFNAHRIHYDHPYATEIEGYPGPVVHGPLLALLLLDAGSRASEGRPIRFTYRAVSPLFSGETFELAGRGGDEGSALELWAAHPDRG